MNVTTDKCYENKEWVWSYRENEPMDTIHTVAQAVELVTASYRKSFFERKSLGLHREQEM